MRHRILSFLTVIFTFVATTQIQGAEKRFLYVATPGIRDYLEYGGHGVIVFDIDIIINS